MRKLGAGGALGVAAAAVVVVAALGWFALVSPQRSKASDLDAQNASAEAQLVTAQHVLATASTAKSLVALRAAKRALPDTPQMSQILRQLSALVARSQTELDSVTPSPAVAGATGGEALPLAVTVKGKYFALQHLLRLLRQSADLRDDSITGHGRLYTVDSIQFAAASANTGTSSGTSSAGGFVTATISMNAFVYAAPAASAASTASDTSSTATTTTDTTTSASGTTP